MADDEEDLDLSPPPRTKVGVALLVIGFHIAVVLALVQAFAPDFTAKVAEKVVSTFTVTVTTPPPKPEPAKEFKPAGASGEAGKKAVARAVKADKPKVDLAKTPAPRAASTGSANTSGASANGNGTGAGGPGNGTGSGNGGNGSGGGRVRFKHIGGAISERDFPRDSAKDRIGKQVVVVFTVGRDGRAHNCRVRDPSGVPAADAMTCKLVLERFRFEPTRDGAGNPIDDSWGWRQRWFL